VAVGKP